MEVGGVPHPRFVGAVDVESQASGLCHGCHLLGLEQSARLRGVQRDHVGGLSLHDLQDVLGRPRTLVGHDRHIHRPGNAGHTRESLDGLLGVADTLLLHLAEDPHRVLGAGPPLVGINHDVDVPTHGGADVPDDAHVVVGGAPHLDLDRPDPLSDRGHSLGGGLLVVHPPQGMGQGDLPAVEASEQLIDRNPKGLTLDVVESLVQGGLGVGVALDR